MWDFFLEEAGPPVRRLPMTQIVGDTTRAVWREHFNCAFLVWLKSEKL